MSGPGGKAVKARIRVLPRRRRDRHQRCPCCGGVDTRVAIDNFGRRYVACARCVIVMPPTVLEEKP